MPFNFIFKAIIYFKNRKVRTPCTLKVTDKELKKLKLYLKMSGIQNYSVDSENKETQIVDLKDKVVIIEDLDVDTDELKTERSILEDLMNGENSWNK